MGIPGQDADAAFFNLMHHFLAAAPKGEGGFDRDEAGFEQRNQSRRAFRQAQWIAPGYCWEVPPQAAWIEVRCYDLAQAGFSFLFDEKPAFERLVAMFHCAEPIYVAARVTHCRPVLVDAWGGIIEPGLQSAVRRSESKFLVGCRFLRRVTT